MVQIELQKTSDKQYPYVYFDKLFIEKGFNDPLIQMYANAPEDIYQFAKNTNPMLRKAIDWAKAIMTSPGRPQSTVCPDQGWKREHVRYKLHYHSLSPSYTSLLAGISKVRAILSANNIRNRVPNGRILETIQCTQFLPYYDEKISVWLPTSGISRITPLVNGPNNMVSSHGVYFGNDIHTNQEIIIDLDKLGASHTLMIGPTRSGKTTAMAITGIRTILNGDDAIYITNKPDSTTNYLAVAEYFSDVSQIINLGRQPDGKTCYNINPLEIIFNENVQFDPISKFYEHLNTVKFFLNLLTGGDRTHKQISYIGETLVELYARFGISPEDRKTWKQEKQPAFLDLYDIWERDRKKYKSDTTIEAVYSRTSSLRNTLRWLSNPTNMDLTKQYTVIDLSAIPLDTQEAMNYLLTAILALRFNIKSKRKTTIMIDEAGVFLKNARLQDEFSRMLKQAGSYGVRIIIGSQQLSDLVSIGHELRANIFIQRYMD